jgi:type VI protein secretion system component Hcp
MIPVVGEAVPIPFNEQIEIDEWNWTLENDEFVSRRAVLDKTQAALDADDDDDDDDDTPAQKAEKQKKKLDHVNQAKNIARQISAIHGQTGRSQAQRDQALKDLMDRADSLSEDLTKSVKEDADGKPVKNKKKTKAKDEDGKLQFTFKKNVDAATTQLLNSMKNGDRMPRAILTLFHRSSNAPVTLAIKFEGVRLRKYDLSVDPSETMSDLKEEWTATYEAVEWSYQNRPPASGPNGVTQGTVRVFKKKNASLL